jgi:hypothetical protein
MATTHRLDELIAKEHAAEPEQPLPQLRGLEPIDAWRRMK